MAGTTITSTINAAIVLGHGGYKGPLSIKSVGAILPPNGHGATAVYVAAGSRHGSVSNAGTIAGETGYGVSGNGDPGGIGLKAMAGVAILNTGKIEGGAGGMSQPGYAGFGGAGIYLGAVGARLVNRGNISGGGGGDHYALVHIGSANPQDGRGGSGLIVTAAAIVNNAGTIRGGGASGGVAGGAGAAFTGNGASLVNTGLIAGGYGGGNGDLGLDASGTINIGNAGIVQGGHGALAVGYSITGAIGGDGLMLTDGGSLANSGTIIAGDGGGADDGEVNVEIDDQGGAGGIGLVLGRAFTSNTGVIQGGVGADSQFSGVGGNGAAVAYGSLANQGIIAGGAGGAGFDPPVSTGNQSGNGANGGAGAIGGDGVVLTVGYLVNTGRISGGTGGAGGLGANGRQGMSGAPDGGDGGSGGAGGNGGDGVRVTGGILLNTGIIAGGDGGVGGNGGTYGSAADGGRNGENGVGGRGGYGLAGVYLDGGTLINAGTISGGTGGANGVGALGPSNSQIGDSVFLGAAKSTLIVEAGAVFVGGIIAQNSADVLELSGTSKIDLTDFGGFGAIEFDAGASWTIAGSAANLAAGQTITGFAPGDAITLETAAAAGKVTVNRAGIVTIKAGGDTYKLDIAGAKKNATNYIFANNTLTEQKTGMAFLAPPAAIDKMPPALPADALARPPATGFLISQAAPVLAPWASGAHDFILTLHKGVETIVTLQTG